MGDLPSIRVLLIGEAGVGKSSIASVLSDDIFNYIYSPTFGAKMHVAFFSTLQGEMEYCVEILEVGGSHRFTASRSIFYDNTDAIIFIWDVNMEMTYHAIDSWLDDIEKYLSQRSTESKESSCQFPVYEGRSLPIPVVIVGNKIDRLNFIDYEALRRGSCSQHIFTSAKSFSDNDKTQWNIFFDKVYDHCKRDAIVIGPSHVSLIQPADSSSVTSSSPMLLFRNLFDTQGPLLRHRDKR